MVTPPPPDPSTDPQPDPEPDPQPDPQPDLGRRLADWLDALGVTDQLGAAGLPRVERAADGSATWLDPGTGEPLTPEQLADLDRVLHGQGDDPRHAVPVALLKLARRASVRAALLAEPWHTYETLAAARGTSLESTRFAVHKASSTHRLLVVAGSTGESMVPAFQLDADGQVRTELLPVLDPLLASGMDAWQVWAWLTRPVALLGGLVASDAVADPEHADLVVTAAIRLAERARTPQVGPGASPGSSSRSSSRSRPRR